MAVLLLVPMCLIWFLAEFPKVTLLFLPFLFAAYCMYLMRKRGG